MAKLPKVSHIQVRGLLISTIIGVGVLSLPNTLAKLLDKDGWLSIVITGLLLIPLIIVIDQIFKLHPGKNFFEIGREVFGSIIFTIYLISFSIYFIVSGSFIVRNLGELVKAFLLPTTPIEMIIAIFIITASYIAIYEIDIIARMGYLTYPITILFVVALIILALPTAKFSNILPLFQSNFKKLPNGIMESLFSFTGFEMLLFTIPYVEERDKVLKSSLIAIGVVTLIYFSLFLITLTQFSIEQIKRQSFPILMVAKLIDLPGAFLQNLDNIFMTIWVVVVFSTMGATYFGAGKVISKVFKLKSHIVPVFVLAPLIYFISLMPQNIVQLNKTLGRAFNVLVLINVILASLLLYGVTLIRRRLGK